LLGKDELMVTRRTIFGAALVLVLATAAIFSAQAENKPTEIRIGTQKGGFLSAVRQRRTVENAFERG
jgi:sulfonate transport system substrate-binding protein